MRRGNSTYPLTDPVRRFLNMPPFATGAATWTGEAFPFLKNISAYQTPKRSDNEFFSVGRYGACNMRKMLIDLFFPDSYRLWELPGTHILFTQEDGHLLSNRLPVIPIFFLLHFVMKICIFWNVAKFQIQSFGLKAFPTWWNIGQGLTLNLDVFIS